MSHASRKTKERRVAAERAEQAARELAEAEQAEREAAERARVAAAELHQARRVVRGEPDRGGNPPGDADGQRAAGRTSTESG